MFCYVNFNEYSCTKGSCLILLFIQVVFYLICHVNNRLLYRTTVKAGCQDNIFSVFHLQLHVWQFVLINFISFGNFNIGLYALQFFPQYELLYLI